MKSKKCSKCGIKQPLENFQKDKSRKDGLHHYCKGCVRIRNFLYRERRKELREARADTPEGYLRETYRRMRKRVSGAQYRSSMRCTRTPQAVNYIGLPICTWEEFRDTFINDSDFLELLAAYTKLPRGQRDYKIAPSIDRIIPEAGYVLHNIEFVTHSQNSKNHHIHTQGRIV